jgi:hypothetical protein
MTSGAAVDAHSVVFLSSAFRPSPRSLDSIPGHSPDYLNPRDGVVVARVLWQIASFRAVPTHLRPSSPPEAQVSTRFLDFQHGIALVTGDARLVVLLSRRRRLMSGALSTPVASGFQPAAPRRRERRAGLEGLLASLTPALRRSGPHLLRPIFEEATRRLVRAEQLRLVEASLTCAGAAAVASAGSRKVSVPVPATLDHGMGGLVLEAVSARTGSFDAWELQLLHAAGQVAALLVELERPRTGPRALLASPTVPDGAAPLIGSTPVMRALRHKIERVAATDFTVLVEGGTGPEAHPDLGVLV